MSNSKTTIQNPVIKNSLQIMRTAIKNRISVNEASQIEGYGRNYVSNAKRVLDQRVQSKAVSRTEASEFKKTYKEYSRVISA